MPGEDSAAAERVRYTGGWVRRREDPRLLTGRGNYVDDLKRLVDNSYVDYAIQQLARYNR